jgi:hypothetical protein
MDALRLAGYGYSALWVRIRNTSFYGYGYGGISRLLRWLLGPWTAGSASRLASSRALGLVRGKGSSQDL